MPARLDPLDRPADDVLLTGDPRRAFALAGALMVQPRMTHQARGLWGYTGETPAGLGLTVQSTGAGASSATAVLGDLAGLGSGRFVRIGSAVAPAGGRSPGSPVLVESAISREGASAGLCEEPVLPVLPDAELMDLLAGIAPPVTVSSHAIVARFDPEGMDPCPGASVRDLQTAGILSIAKRLGRQAAAVLVISGNGGVESLNEKQLNSRFIEVGREIVERLQPSEA